MVVIFLSFAAGLVLIRLGHVRAAVLEVGALMLAGGLGFNYLKEAVIRSVSRSTGKSVAQLREELKKR